MGQPAATGARRHRMVSTRCRLINLVMLASLLMVGGFLAAGVASATEVEGGALLKRNCGGCHAIGADEASRLPAAPPMRDIYSRYASSELEAVILQGAVSHFEGMPQIEFSLAEVHLIMAYLASLRPQVPGK